MRLAPLEPPYPPPIEDSLRRLMGPATAVEPLALFRTIAHHPQLLDRFRQIGSSLLSFGELEPRDREVLIHRTTARCGAEYEWGVHATLFARALGLSDDWIAATWSGSAEEFGERDALLVQTADALHDTATLPAALYDGLADAFTPSQLVEIVCVCGFYHLVSFLCGAFAIAPEPWAEPAP